MIAKVLLAVGTLLLAAPAAHARAGVQSGAEWRASVEADWMRRVGGGSGDRLKLKAATAKALKLARATLEFVERVTDRPAMAAELLRLERQAAAAGEDEDWKSLYLKARWLRRRIILSHPLLDFDRLLINKRPPPLVGVASHMCDQLLGRWSVPGPGLCVLDWWKEQPRCRELLAGKLPTGCVMHPDLSFDAERVIFAFCDHTVPGPEAWHDRPELLLSTMNAFLPARMQKRQIAPAHRPGLQRMLEHVVEAAPRRFFIYELDLATGRVRQLTGTRADPLAGWQGRQTALIEDFDPCYLPGGGFVFVSTRCQAYGRCHAGRYAPSYVLYRADADGSNIERISFGEVNEWEPSVLPDARIVFCRWDYINRNNQPFLSLWACRTDGTNVVHFYGNYTRNPCMVSEPRAIAGSHKVVATACGHHSFTAGSIIAIDPEKGLDGPAPIKRITPEVPLPEMEGWPQENYATPWPLGEELFLVAYAPDPLGWGQPAPRPNGYGIYLIDTLGGRELIYRDPDISCFLPMPLEPRPVPPVVAPSLRDGERIPERRDYEACEPARHRSDEGIFFVQDVYRSRPDVEAGIPRGTVKGLRVIRIHPQPTPGRAFSGAVANEVVKGIVGAVPVNPDGSVAFRAPADVPLMFQLLDQRGMAVMTMRSQVWVRPGEVLGCVGCHEPRHTTGPTTVTTLPERIEVRELDPPAGLRHEGGFSFARTVQPVLDRHCIRCHGLEETAGGLNLIGTPTTRQCTGYQMGFSVAYESLVARPELIAHLGHESFEFRQAYRAWADPPARFRGLGAWGATLFRQYTQLANLRAADRDADGRLTRREAPPIMHTRFAAIDSDKDGQVDLGELYRAVERQRDRPDAVHGRWVALALTGIESTQSSPRDYYAHASRLPWLLVGEHRKYVELDRENFLRIVQWLDLNGQYFGDYSFNRPERRRPSPEGERQLRRSIARTCGRCHEGMSEQPFAALVNMALLEESRVLQAPLAASAGGWSQCRGLHWPAKTAPGYQAMLKHVQAATGPPGPTDLAGSCGREPCICGACWVRKLGARRTASSGLAQEP